MRNHHFTLLAAVATAGLLALTGPALAQEPTPKDPIRFTAFAIQMQGGVSGTIDIVIERWSTSEEREKLISIVAVTTDTRDDQEKLLEALQAIEPRVGYIRTAGSLGWDLKYAWEHELEDGSRQIVIVTDKPVSFLAAAGNQRTMDYPFTLIDMRFPAGSNKGEGKLLGRTSISVEEGRLQLELYGQEPTRLTTITQK